MSNMREILVFAMVTFIFVIETILLYEKLLLGINFRDSFPRALCVACFFWIFAFVMKIIFNILLYLL